jgi:galactokinase
VGAAATRLADLDVSREDLALLCRRAENEFVGVSCGIMDQFTVTFGEAGHALFLDCRTREHRHIPFGEGAGVRTVVVDTNVAHELADSAYNERLATCRDGADRFDALLDHEVSALRDVSAAEFEAHADDLPEPMRSRCAHVVSENERVRAAADALAAGDVEGVGEAMVRSHESLRDDYEVSCDELDAVVECARDAAGVVGARMTGGGFGGSVVCLVHEGAVGAFSEQVARTYRDATGVEADVYACTTVDGVTVREPPTE